MKQSQRLQGGSDERDNNLDFNNDNMCLRKNENDWLNAQHQHLLDTTDWMWEEETPWVV